jgi:hypothetical protein
MSEQQTGMNEFSQDEQNEALLRRSELGVVLAEAYREAANLDPRLGKVKVVPIDDPQEKSHAFAVASDVSASGQHEVHVRLDNLDEVLDKYAQAMRDFPVSIDVISKRMNVDPSSVTPQFLYVQSVLHEMGHVTEHMDYEDNMDDLRLRNKQERATLPLGYHSLTKLMDPSSELRQRVDRHWNELSTKHGVDDIEGLARVQGEAYRNLTSEHHADTFAADVFDTDPQLVQQLSQPSVGAYRNFPIAA